MGKFERKQNSKQSPARALAIPVAGAVILMAVIMGGILHAHQAPRTTGYTVSAAAAFSLEPSLEPNPFLPDDFYYENGYLTTSAAPVRRGVDVSEFQQDIDWPQVAASGVEFAFIRLGYRGYGTGGLYMDSNAEKNLKGARDAGLQVGAYFYSQALTPTEAAHEAAFCISMLKDYEIDLPVVFDWEYVSEDARTGDADMKTVTDCALVFCRAMEDAGYQPMIYFNPHVADNHLDLYRLEQYPFWLALYSDTMDYPNRVEFWQYTSSGSVPGIPGSTDINLWFPQ